MVRLKDIAARGGVSIMTVSKALRDAPDISAATKARIRLLAQQMGYVPDSAAQTLRSRTTKLFGVVIPSLINPLFVRVLTAIEERAFELGYEVMLAHSLNLVEREEAVIRRLLSRRVDGLFIAPLYRIETQAAIFDELARRGTPTVLLGPRAAMSLRRTIPIGSQFKHWNRSNGVSGARSERSCRRSSASNKAPAGFGEWSLHRRPTAASAPGHRPSEKSPAFGSTP